ncbi:hypothetical protein [Streptomyces sp. NPDC058011]|uniref:hypothetical protein n=1 Tax=Streptomyces sp. NPDC058011 TaxID=3346305 RepID=UPI0036E5254C
MGACLGCAYVRGIEPGTPDAIGVRTAEKGERGFVSPMGFATLSEHGMCVGLVQNGDH